MIHRDGTVIARYPHDDSLIGKNVADSPSFRKALAVDGNASGRFKPFRRGRGEDRLDPGPDEFSDPDRRRDQRIVGAGRLAGAEPSCSFPRPFSLSSS